MQSILMIKVYFALSLTRFYFIICRGRKSPEKKEQEDSESVRSMKGLLNLWYISAP